MAAVEVAELSKLETDVLMGLYSGSECLWNPQASDYNEKLMRSAAFRGIVKGLHTETGLKLTIHQVAWKIKCLLSDYEEELKKVLQSQMESNENSVYHSQWRWFSFLDSFLHKHVLKKIENPDSANIEDPDQFIFGDQSITSVQSHNSITPMDDGHSGSSVQMNNISDIVERGSPSAVGRNLSQLSNLVHSVKKRKPVNLSAKSDLNRKGGGVNKGVNGTHSMTKDVTLGERSAARRPSRKREYPRSSKPPVTKHPVQSTPVYILPNFSQVNLAHTPITSSPFPTLVEPLTGSPSSISHIVHASTGTVNTGCVHNGANDPAMASIANTLHTLQTLMAKSLSAQDHPSFVFSRHISNELDAITDYAKRKQCMLEIQQVIVRYQSQTEKRTCNIKREQTGVDVDDDGEALEDEAQDSTQYQSQRSWFLT